MTLPGRTVPALPLWILALALVGANYWAYTVDIEAPLRAPPAPSGTDPAAASAMSEPASLMVPAPGDLTETLARPLFLAERRVVPPTTLTAAAEPVGPAAPMDLELAGTMQASGIGMALIRTPRKREGQWAKTGTKIGAWTVVEVRGDVAVIERDGARTELRLKPAGQTEGMKPPTP